MDNPLLSRRLCGSGVTGTISFLDGSTAIGTGTISGGSASFTTSTLTAGVHSITASYGGDSNNAAATSAVLSQTVNKASPMFADSGGVDFRPCCGCTGDDYGDGASWGFRAGNVLEWRDAD